MSTEAKPQPEAWETIVEETGQMSPEELGRLDVKELKRRIEVMKDAIKESKEKLEKADDVIKKGIEANPKLKKKLEKIRKKKEERLKEIDKEEKEKKKVRENAVMAIKQNIAKIKPEHFNERYIPKSWLYDPNFMRYVPGDKFMALMESKGLDDNEKETIIRMRFKFCFDWLESKEYKKYKKDKETYDKAFQRWLDDEKKQLDQYENPILKDENGDILKDENGEPITQEPKFVSDPDGEIREMFRNNIRNIKELAILHQYVPKIFDIFDIVGHIQFGMVQDIRKHEAFAGRGRHIRAVKFQDFYDIIKHLKDAGVGKAGDNNGKGSLEYFRTFTDPKQLVALRKRMRVAFLGKGGRGKEIAGGGSGIHQSPLVIDLYDKSILPGFLESDDEDKKNIIQHMLVAEALEQIKTKEGVKKPGILTDQNQLALDWISFDPSGQKFFDVNIAFEELQKEKWFRDEFPDYKLPEKRRKAKPKDSRTEIEES